MKIHCAGEKVLPIPERGASVSALEGVRLPPPASKSKPKLSAEGCDEVKTASLRSVEEGSTPSPSIKKPLFHDGKKESLTIEGIEVYILCLKDQKEQIESQITRYEKAAEIRRKFDEK